MDVTDVKSRPRSGSGRGRRHRHAGRTSRGETEGGGGVTRAKYTALMNPALPNMRF